MKNRINLEIATLAGGCFWCTEAIFKRLKGVVEVMSGYTGGSVENPIYEDVLTGQTRHVEAVQIKYNPNIISFEKLLDIFWATHDPTTLNRQGTDVGSQYRSVIFYHSAKQKDIAEKSKKEMDESGNLNSKVVTEIKPFEKFYTAEEYHQKFYDRNPEYPYCSIIIAPKVQKLLNKFNEEVKDEYKIESKEFILNS